MEPIVELTRFGTNKSIATNKIIATNKNIEVDVKLNLVASKYVENIYVLIYSSTMTVSATLAAFILSSLFRQYKSSWSKPTTSSTRR